VIGGKWRVAADYALIALGAFLVAVAADVFLIPNRVVSGGLTGIAIVLYYLIGTPVGLVSLILNIPLFLANLRWGGGLPATIKTIFAVVVMSASIDLLQPYVPRVTTDPLLYTIYGGLVDGLGLGLVFRAGGTTGGTDIIASLAHRLAGVKLGHTLLGSNVIILGMAAFVFGLEPALYALLLAFVSSRVIDVVQEGLSQSRSTFIISRRPDQVKQAILEQMERGVTVLYGEGAFTGEPREVLLCAVPQSELSRLKRLIQTADPEAFVIVVPAHEVLGEGFRGLTTS
jgi:uncharacterized membrane-anchored protein YitT (DUF2179 family)